MITTQQAAAILGVSRRRVLALIGSGDIAATKYGSTWMVDEASVKQRAATPHRAGRPLQGTRNPHAFATYTLMNKNHEVADITFNAESQTVAKISHEKEVSHAPFGACIGQGHLSLAALSDWMAHRSMPQGRPHVGDVLRKARAQTPLDLMLRCLGLNLSDQYWFRPASSALSWEDVNFFENGYDDELGFASAGLGTANDLTQARSPSAATNGVLGKWWERRGDANVLVKGGSQLDHEPFAECLASKLYGCLLDESDYVNYDIRIIEGRAFSTCEGFITASTELVTMHDIMTCFAHSQPTSRYHRYLDLCRAFGIGNAEEKIAKMIVCDYLTGNQDRHERNLGIVCDAETHEWMNVAPLYDSGLAFYFMASTPQELEYGLYRYESTPFSRYPTMQLALVDDYLWYDPTRLAVFGETIVDTLSANGRMPEGMALACARQFARRVEQVNIMAAEHNPTLIGVDVDVLGAAACSHKHPYED